MSCGRVNPVLNPKVFIANGLCGNEHDHYIQDYFEGDLKKRINATISLLLLQIILLNHFLSELCVLEES